MPEGYYVVATYKAEGNFPAEFERLCNIDETVMRSMTLKLEYDAAEKKAAKLAEAPAVEAVAEEAATEEVVAAEATEATDAE
jgi:ribosomal protein S6